MIRMGRFQRDALAKLASSPGGLTSADLSVLSATGNSRHAARVLHVLGKRGLARRTGRQRGGTTLGRWPDVWVITLAGRAVNDAVLAADSARSREQVRRDRRDAVAAAIADGMGPDTPREDAMARAAVMRQAGCNERDIALVFAVPLSVVARLEGGQ
jgi:hypothetical protein